MIVYLDILLGINLIVNYYLLLLTVKFASDNAKGWRILIGAAVGSLFSLYIFFDINSTIFDCFIKIICSMLMILSSVGFINIKAYLRNVTILFVVSFIYSGGMMALWSFFKWDTIVINNSTVYLNISPLNLILISVIFYIILVISKSVFKKNSVKAERAVVELYFKEKKAELIAIFDTGNSVRDILSDSAVIFISHKKAIDFLCEEPSAFEKNYRLLPCSTVTGSKLLEAVRIDKAVVIVNKSAITLLNPILAISEIGIDKEYSLILNPEILMSSEVCYDNDTYSESNV